MRTSRNKMRLLRSMSRSGSNSSTFSVCNGLGMSSTGTVHEGIVSMPHSSHHRNGKETHKGSPSPYHSIRHDRRLSSNAGNLYPINSHCVRHGGVELNFKTKPRDTKVVSKNRPPVTCSSNATSAKSWPYDGLTINEMVQSTSYVEQSKRYCHQLNDHSTTSDTRQGNTTVNIDNIPTRDQYPAEENPPANEHNSDSLDQELQETGEGDETLTLPLSVTDENMDIDSPVENIKAKAFAICKAYLDGMWKNIDTHDLIVKRISGGLSNYLYHCSVLPSVRPVNNEPSQVLLRFYGQIHGESALESVITESVIFTLLSERKLGPKLYGVFPGGRIEQFIPARPLKTKELSVPKISNLIAQKTAHIHGLNIPLSKEPSWLWNTLERWTSNAAAILEGDLKEHKEFQSEIYFLRSYDFEQEMKWLRCFVENSNSPVLFTHNDLQEGNILMRLHYEDYEDMLTLIDFEYCSYNYRGFDLANHFCEWVFCYTEDKYPYYRSDPSSYPSKEEQLSFIRIYINTLKEELKNSGREPDQGANHFDKLFDENNILKEVEAFQLLSHFFWALWSIVNAPVSKIPFGYWNYAMCRLQAYQTLKSEDVGRESKK